MEMHGYTREKRQRLDLYGLFEAIDVLDKPKLAALNPLVQGQSSARFIRYLPKHSATEELDLNGKAPSEDEVLGVLASSTGCRGQLTEHCAGQVVCGFGGERLFPLYWTGPKSPIPNKSTVPWFFSAKGFVLVRTSGFQTQVLTLRLKNGPLSPICEVESTLYQTAAECVDANPHLTEALATAKKLVGIFASIQTPKEPVDYFPATI